MSEILLHILRQINVMAVGRAWALEIKQPLSGVSALSHNGSCGPKKVTYPPRFNFPY